MPIIQNDKFYPPNLSALTHLPFLWSQLVDSQQASETIDPNRDYRENRTERDETIPNTNKFKFEITEASRQCSIDQITKLRITYRAVFRKFYIKGHQYQMQFHLFPGSRRWSKTSLYA